MQILKENSAGITFSPFAIGGVWNLQVAVLHYFSLESPDTALPEQDLWNECAKELGTAVLDAGFPKPRGEVLIAGSWHSPSRQAEQGGYASFRAGPLFRRLAVFGPRYWQDMPLAAISEPRAVTAVPLTWESALGGPDFPENPAGIGTQGVPAPWGGMCRPLPMVEDPSQGLVTSPSSRPTPASFLPSAADRPSRLALAGTYDARWLNEFWPGFPQDVDPEFFMTADPAQRLPKDYSGGDASCEPGFFAGGEEFLLENMHPARARLLGRLPRKRVRVFATRSLEKPGTGCPAQAGTGVKEPEKSRFEEAQAHLETVWFFPGIERGVAIYRCVLPCADDEYSDIVSLMPVVEDRDAPLTGIACWLEEKKRRTPAIELPRPSIPPEAQKAMAQASDAVRTLEEDLNLAADRAMGKAPAIEPDHQAMLAQARAKVRQELESLDKNCADLASLNKQFGAACKVRPDAFDGLKASLQDMLGQLEKAEASLKEAEGLMAQGEKALAEGIQRTEGLIDAIPPTDVDKELHKGKAKMHELDGLLSGRTWNTQVLSILSRCHLSTSTDPAAEKICEQLALCGLRTKDIHHALLGCLSKPTELAPEDLCLKKEDVQDSACLANGKILLPPGLAVPFFTKNECTALHIRPFKEDGTDFFAALDPDDSFVVPGSKDGCQLLGAIRPKPVLLAEDPLTAWLLYSRAGDIFAILLVTGRDAAISDDAAKALDEAPLVFWPVPPLGKEAAEDGLAPESPAFTPAQRLMRQEELCSKWPNLAAWHKKKRLFPIAWPEKWSTPNLAKAHVQGLDIRAWLKDELEKRGIQAACAAEGSVSLGTDADGSQKIALKVPSVDIKGIRERLSKRIAEFRLPQMEQAENEFRKAVGEFNVLRRQNGLKDFVLPEPGLDELLHTPFPTDPDMDTLKRFEDLAGRVGKMKGEAAKAKILAMRDKYLEDLKKLGALDTRARAAIIAHRKEMASGAMGSGDLPEWVSSVPGAEEMLSGKAGLPPSAAALKVGMKGKTLKDIDMSGMDLKGMSLENCFLENVDFSNALLDESRWEKVMAKGCSFAGASCTGAKFEQCSFDECIFVKTNLQDARAELCQWQKGSLQDPGLKGASIRLATFDGVRIKGTIEEAFLELSSFDKCPIEDMSLLECTLKKVTFINALISHMRAEGGSWKETGFTTCKGTGLAVRRLACENMRFLMHCDIANVVFEQCILPGLCLRESRLPALVMKGCSFDDAMADYCDLPRAVLAGCSGTKARFLHCDLEGSDLRYLRLPQGSLRKSRLVQANLHCANLYGADMYKAVLGETDLTGANLAGTLLEGKKKEMQDMELSR